MYSLEWRDDQRLLIVHKFGFWDAETLDRYCIDLRNALDRLSHMPAPTRCLLDQRDLPVQSPAYVARMVGLFQDPHVKQPTKSAAVMASTLTAMQDNRMIADTVSNHADYRTFKTRDEALAWLLAD